MTVTSLVPRLRPAIDGVGDYGFNLASQIYKDYNIFTQFIIGDPTWQRNNTLKSIEASAVSCRSAASLFTRLQGSSTVILHYVPHGYARKACPLWLVQGLEQWKTATANASLITMFHELYALDWHRPWSSDFYLSPVQQYLAARIVQLSDACLTSTERYRYTIQHLSRGRHLEVSVLPVPSNVGEPAQILPLSQRQPRLVIFGQPRTKDRIYRYSQILLEQVCQRLNLQEIWDIGPSVEGTPQYIGAVPIKQLGKLRESDISQILSESVAGFLNYDPKRLGKSGIFAAYCAHGIVPINHSYTSHSIDGLVANQQYWCPRLENFPGAGPDTIVDQALVWYRRHALAQQAAVFIDRLSTLGQLQQRPMNAIVDNGQP